MQVLEKIKCSATNWGDSIAIHSRTGEISYSSLWDNSDRLASMLDIKLKSNKKPVVVYGHKNPLMIVCFLACVKSGRAYCPVDTSMPTERIKAIIEAVGNSMILTTEDMDVEALPAGVEVVDATNISEILQEHSPIEKENWIKPNDTFYIIFTSGSTGMPKGVEITSENLSRFTDWSVTLGDAPTSKQGKVFLNQAPFSFDLSVMDLYTSLVSGGTLYCIDKQLQSDNKAMLDYMSKGNINYWISTPSFADMCLADASFDRKLLPEMRSFLFCGEKLTAETASRLYERFDNANVVNTYGPTESTVAVSETVITREMFTSKEPLPIGRVRQGSLIRIIDETGQALADGEKGEIQILGNTVSSGYFNNPEKTNEVFSMVDINGEPMRAYRTGDEGYMRDGMLYYSGRLDFQIKLHGYRIELGDIESNLLQIDGVMGACVLPKYKDDKIRYLVGLVVKHGSEDNFEERKAIREALRGKLPDYMVPKKIVFIDNMPMTSNGKADRKVLKEYI